MADKTWIETVAPIVKKCELAASLKMKVEFRGEGAAALGLLIKKMAEYLDQTETPTSK